MLSSTIIKVSHYLFPGVYRCRWKTRPIDGLPVKQMVDGATLYVGASLYYQFKCQVELHLPRKYDDIGTYI